MRIMEAVRNLFAGEQRQAPGPDDDYWYTNLAGLTSSGWQVTPELSLKYSAVYACVKILAETVGSLPLHLYRRSTDGGKSRAPEHNLQTILHDAPNPEQTASQFWELSVAQMALWGNGYSYIRRAVTGEVMDLTPLASARMRVSRGAYSKRVRYEYRQENGQLVSFGSDEIFHPRLFSIDGLTGLSPVEQARESIALGLSNREFAQRLYTNGAILSGMLKHPGRLRPETHENLKKDFGKKYAGLANAFKPIILEEGMDWQQISMPAKDAMFVESAKASITDIARWYRIPPHMIGDLERATFSNIEQQSLEFVTYTLMPWLVKIEQEINRKLLLPEERGTYFAKFLVDGLLRGDIASRYTAYATGRQWGWLSVNDIRTREDMNPIEEGDTYLQPLNMAPLGTEDAAEEDEPAADKPPEPDQEDEGDGDAQE